ncbi:hypothetical protein FRB91_011057 [Serendipita sp. 411]|nr:hypothetical protein FRB91_011057 [Serendipita sp. 411]
MYRKGLQRNEFLIKGLLVLVRLDSRVGPDVQTRTQSPSTCITENPAELGRQSKDYGVVRFTRHSLRPAGPPPPTMALTTSATRQHPTFSQEQWFQYR